MSNSAALQLALLILPKCPVQTGQNVNRTESISLVAEGQK